MRKNGYSDEEMNKLRYTQVSRFNKMTRKEFLEQASKHLGNAQNATFSADYKDLDKKDEVLVASVL